MSKEVVWQTEMGWSECRLGGAVAALQRCERFVQWWVGCLLIQLQRIFEPLGDSLQSTDAWRGSERKGRLAVLGAEGVIWKRFR